MPTWRPTFSKAQPAPTRGPLGLNSGLLQLNPISARSCCAWAWCPQGSAGLRGWVGAPGAGPSQAGWLLAWHFHREQCSVDRVEKMVCVPFSCKQRGPGRSADRALTASRPQRLGCRSWWRQCSGTTGPTWTCRARVSTESLGEALSPDAQGGHGASFLAHQSLSCLCFIADSPQGAGSQGAACVSCGRSSWDGLSCGGGRWAP